MGNNAAAELLFFPSDNPNGPSSRRSVPPPISGVIALKTDFADATGLIVRGDADGSVILRLEAGIEGRIVRFNPIAMWFEADDAIEMPINQTIEATLEWKGPSIGPLFGRVIPSPRSEKEWCFQIELRNLDFDAASAMMEMLDELLARGAAEAPAPLSVVSEDIDELDRVRKVVLALSVLKGTSTLRGPGNVTRVQMAEILDTDAILWKPLEPLGQIGAGDYSIEVIGYNSLYQLDVPIRIARNGMLVTGMPTRVRRLRRRVFRRCTLAEPTNIRFLHPRWLNEGLCSRLIRDISFGGLSFLTSIDRDILFPGIRIPLMTMEVAGEILRLSGTVRSMTRLDSGEYICGMSVAPWSADDETPWIRFVADQLSPTTQTSENVLEALWDLFESSGYFNLAGKQPEDFAELRQSFFRLGKRAPEMPQLICQAVWPSCRGIEGTVSFTKTYSTSWMGHQLAKRNGSVPASATDAGQILREVYTRTFEHPQADRAFEWVVCYVEPTVRWIARSHLGFAERHTDTEDVYAKKIHMMTARCDEHIVPSADIQVEPATPKERQILAAEIAKTRPRPYVQALDLTPDNIAMDTICDQWRHAGIERERAIFAARRNGVAVAFGIFEIGQLGTNLFRLLDCVRIVPLGSDPDPSAHAAIIERARRWYTSRRRSEFLYLREDNDSSYASAARLHEDSEPCLWIIAARHVPDFLEHICEVTGPRENRPQPSDEPASLRPTDRNLVAAIYTARNSLSERTNAQSGE